MSREIDIVAVGDVHPTSTAKTTENRSRWFGRTLRGFDLAIANSEDSIDYKAPDTNGARSAFRSDRRVAAEVYAYTGFDAVSLANNYQIDTHKRRTIPEVGRTIKP